MKNLFIFLILAVCSGCHPGQTVLKGHIENYRGEIVRIFPEGQSGYCDTLAIDSLGNFMFSPAVGEWGIYEVSIKDHSPWIQVYIGKEDQVEMKLVLQKNKWADAVFSGDRMAENTYLQLYCEIKKRRFWKEPEIKGCSFQCFRDKIDNTQKELQGMLDKVKDGIARKTLAVKQHLMLQEHRLTYDWTQEENQKPDADYEAFVKSIDLNDPEQANERIMEGVIDWYLKRERADELSDYLIAYLEILENKVTDRQIINREATRMVTAQFHYFSSNLDNVMTVYNRLCSDDSIRQAVNDEYREYMRTFGNLMPGKMAPDFEMTDATGKKCRLSDLRGKYLFIDIWATWCAPCREEMPHMAKLHRHFAKDNRVALLSISVDNNTKAWKQFIEREKPAWTQYVVDRHTNDFLDREYRIYGLPHFMLLDPEGRFVEYAFCRPSEPGCANLIENNMKQ